MREIRVTLECGRPHSPKREWFSTIMLLTEAEIARGEHVVIAKYRARIHGYVEPFEEFKPWVPRTLPPQDHVSPSEDEVVPPADAPPEALPRDPSTSAQPIGDEGTSAPRRASGARR